MIKKASAIRFDRIAEFGRNEPLRVTVETEHGNECEVFLKPSGRPEVGVEGMANELLAACIAGHLGLPICEPILVEMSPEWIASIQSPEVREVLNQSCAIAFGSTAAGTAWRRWTDEDRIIGDRRAAALGIFAFDVFSENRDRLIRNPNLLVRGDEFRIIDHELCFKIRMCLFPKPEPWRVGYLANHVSQAADGHVFGARLKGDRYIDIDALGPAWAGLSDEHLALYGATLPDEWNEASEAIQDALKHLRMVRDRIDDCLVEMRRALT